VQRTSDAFLKSGFFERAVANQTDAFGTIVHVFSTYESRRAKDDEKPFARGINSIQAMQHAGRWWIVTVMWDQERADNRFRRSTSEVARRRRSSCRGDLRERRGGEDRTRGVPGGRPVGWPGGTWNTWA